MSIINRYILRQFVVNFLILGVVVATGLSDSVTSIHAFYK